MKRSQCGGSLSLSYDHSLSHQHLLGPGRSTTDQSVGHTVKLELRFLSIAIEEICTEWERQNIRSLNNKLLFCIINQSHGANVAVHRCIQRHSISILLRLIGLFTFSLAFSSWNPFICVLLAFLAFLFDFHWFECNLFIFYLVIPWLFGATVTWMYANWFSFYHRCHFTWRYRKCSVTIGKALCTGDWLALSPMLQATDRRQ